MIPDPFLYRDGELYCEDVRLREIAAAAGTPCFVYGAAGIRHRFYAYQQALAGLPHTICYAVKANSSLAILKLLADAGSGFDIVSAGELFRVLRAGGDPAKVVFSGVGKTEAEIGYALEQGIHGFNCESESELRLLADVARRKGMRAKAALRVNPDVDANTHPYISTGLQEHKFGVPFDEAERLYLAYRAEPGLEWVGISCHIGSQILDVRPLVEAVEKVLAFATALREAGIGISEIDIGGGLGIAYRPHETPTAIPAFMEQVLHKLGRGGFSLAVEPGRSLVAESGVLLTRVLHLKPGSSRNFLIVDAAMNDLIRPSLYSAHHEIAPLTIRPGEPMVADVVGPVCESGDFFARQRVLPAMQQGEWLALCAAGAYGFSLSSNYNARPRAAEVLVEGDRWRVVRERESWEDLVRGESV
ncbi:MAG: diaminopimelate decarboxylase [Bryobacterales bacterium]|nr:diaminopimelate decarboxylase [Bryobacterales bacterium]